MNPNEAAALFHVQPYTVSRFVKCFLRLSRWPKNYCYSNLVAICLSMNAGMDFEFTNNVRRSLHPNDVSSAPKSCCPLPIGVTNIVNWLSYTVTSNTPSIIPPRKIRCRFRVAATGESQRPGCPVNLSNSRYPVFSSSLQI